MLTQLKLIKKMKFKFMIKKQLLNRCRLLLAPEAGLFPRNYITFFILLLLTLQINISCESSISITNSTAFKSLKFLQLEKQEVQSINNNMDNLNLAKINNTNKKALSYKSEATVYTKTFKHIINNFFGYLQEVTNRVDFLSLDESESFKFDLDSNLKFFLQEYYTKNLTELQANNAYTQYIKSTYKKRTIIIGIDGLAQVCAKLESYKSFAYVMSQGSFKFKIRSTTEGMSGPGWTSLLYGLNSEKTGVIDNSWKAPWVTKSNLKNYIYSSPVTGLEKPLPSIFEVLKSKKGENFKNVFYSSWDFFYENLSNKAIPDSIDIYSECIISENKFLDEYASCDQYGLEAAKNIVLKDFDFYFWYFSSLDVVGHNRGFCSYSYFEILDNIDKLLLGFLEHLWELQILDKVNIIITSDHGTDRNHGAHGNDKYDGNLFVPLFMMGPDFKKNFRIQDEISILDVAPTIALINEVFPSAYWMGKPITSALNSYDENLVRKIIYAVPPGV